jgi:two-component system cell cycle sensor histidine kinase/response regulator CckA
VGQLLAFSRKQTLKPQILDLRDTLSDLTHLLNRLVGERVLLTFTNDPALRPIRADRRQLEQVLMNLVVNARDAMPRGGEITIRTDNVRLGAAQAVDRASLPRGDYVCVTVADEGCGIAADQIDKIFDPFFTTKRQGEGTGLGLSTVYGIVKQTGGYVFCDSTVGQGTTFTLYFPAQKAHVHAAPPLAPAPVPAAEDPTFQDRQHTVLLVEDEAPVRAFAARALRLRGFEVIEADCAERALDLLADDRLTVDLFVTDVVMPGMDGPTWVRAALRHRPGTKVIFVSGYSEVTLSDASAPIPGALFLPKPFSLSELTATVENHLAGRPGPAVSAEATLIH